MGTYSTDKFSVLTKRKALRKGASEEQIFAAQQKAKTMAKLIAENKKAAH